MRWVMTLVLPLPGPASTSSGPSVMVTAWRCGGLRPRSRSAVAAVVASASVWADLGSASGEVAMLTDPRLVAARPKRGALQRVTITEVFLEVLLFDSRIVPPGPHLCERSYALGGCPTARPLRYVDCSRGLLRRWRSSPFGGAQPFHIFQTGGKLYCGAPLRPTIRSHDRFMVSLAAAREQNGN